ncbi:TRAP transporter large permease subunit [Alkalicoccobacillus murimartini]|uniref:TRAP-type C4-dicarboxylate transport system permease large subunit n=1 Tax=Alkalicoccobacillus murimartini TaxID=171685 RepID=A0ABT9YGB1_9BACI|nr:TRAP transporter large permease subunit [Alkalicoccobacillus murimartini]MDQ0206902.1 TRAP-type C4-dicarboxylate transport system permease large subunit [Alkalicoccobacillus murimartini]
MGISVWALIVFIIVILIWAIFTKRNISEAMIIGFLITLAFSGTRAVELFLPSLMKGLTHSVVFASLAFIFMAQLINYTGLIGRIIQILNSLIGRLPGGAAYVNTIGSGLFALVAGSGSGIAATTGAITIPWMEKSGWKKEHASSIVAGNSGFGSIIPPNSTMFIMLGFAPVAATVDFNNLFLALYVAGAYALLHRIIVVFLMTKRYKIQPVPAEFILPFSKTFKEGWHSLIIFLGIVIPILINFGPLATWFNSIESVGAEAMDSISFIVWVPVFMILFTLLVGRNHLPKSKIGWKDFFEKTAPSYFVIGPVLIFTFATSAVLNELGLTEELQALMTAFDLPKWLMIALVGIIITLVATPLATTATVATIGLATFGALTAVGVDPLLAVVTIMMFGATEGSTPTSGPIYVATGMAKVGPEKTYVPLLLYYTIPLMIISWLIGMGILPIPI